MTRLQQIREMKNLSQDQLAGKAGVQQATISLVERGKARATAAFAEKVAAVLGPELSEPEILYPERYPLQAEKAA